MAKTRYGKLVRDKIPEIIRADSQIPNVRTMEADEYRRELLYKLIEESEELRQAGYDAASGDFLKELADVSEVLDAILVEFGISREELAKKQSERKSTRGGFVDRIFLESIEE